MRRQSFQHRRHPPASVASCTYSDGGRSYENPRGESLRRYRVLRPRKPRSDRQTGYGVRCRGHRRHVPPPQQPVALLPVYVHRRDARNCHACREAGLRRGLYLLQPRHRPVRGEAARGYSRDRDPGICCTGGPHDGLYLLSRDGGLPERQDSGVARAGRTASTSTSPRSARSTSTRTTSISTRPRRARS